MVIASETHALQRLPRRGPTKEAERFLRGQGRFIADLSLPGTKHMALVSSPHAHARIRAIDTSAALKMPGVCTVVTGAELAAHTNPIGNYLYKKNVEWYPLAFEKAHYAGEWVVAVVADTRYQAEDAAEAVLVDYEPLAPVVDMEAALAPDSPLVHEAVGSNVLWHRDLTWGDVDGDFARADVVVRDRLYWGRHSGVPIETFGVLACYHVADDLFEFWGSWHMPYVPDRVSRGLKVPMNRVRIHYDVDVGGSFGSKCGYKHAILTGYLARKLHAPVAFQEDRLENMRSGDAHGPNRLYDVAAAAMKDGRITSLKMRVIDDQGAWPMIGVIQIGKPITALVGPYKIGSCQYDATLVMTNKAVQGAFRGLGQSPTNFAVERIVDLVAEQLGLDRVAVRERNLIERGDFPYAIPTGTSYDSGDPPLLLRRVLEMADLERWKRYRAEARERGRHVGIGIAIGVEPSGGNTTFKALMTPDDPVTTYPEGCFVKIDPEGGVTAQIGFPTQGQGHETMVATVVGAELGVAPEQVTVIRTDSLSTLPTHMPIASRSAMMLGSAAFLAAQALKQKMARIAAHNLEVAPTDVEHRDGAFYVCGTSRSVSFVEVAKIAHRQWHRMPPDEEPGLQSIRVWMAPTTGQLPDSENRVQIYPCSAFGAHVAIVEVDPDTGMVEILKYYVAHDCGTVFNPEIVAGMVCGGIAHGIGGTLQEEFAYSEDGQFLAGTFMDYLIPSATQVPDVELDESIQSPSPITPLGQKGIAEGGYMTSPGAIVSAVEDALKQAGGGRISRIPMTPEYLHGLFAQARAHAHGH